MPPTPSITVGAELRVADEAGDQLAVARAPSGRRAATTSPSSGVAAASSSAAAASHGRGVGEAQAHQAALGLVGDGVAVELDHDREAELAAAAARLVGRRRPRRSSATGTPCPAQQLLRGGLGERRCSRRQATAARCRSASTLAHHAWPVLPPRTSALAEHRAPALAHDPPLGHERPRRSQRVEVLDVQVDGGERRASAVAPTPIAGTTHASRAARRSPRRAPRPPACFSSARNGRRMRQ